MSTSIVVGYNRNQIIPSTREVCRFHLRGICRFGSRCRNVHIEMGSSEVADKSTGLGQSRSNTNQENASSLHSYLESENASTNVSTESGPSTSSVASVAWATKSCGICFDTIMEKANKREQTFGILPNCNHCFCFTCIRKWRQSKEFDFDVSKACPECRKHSDYVYPSKIWFEIIEDKESFISKEKTRMQKINCRYFNKGQGACPFGNTCLYRHALPNGKKMDVGPPKPRRRRPENIDEDMFYQIYWLNDDDLDIEEDDDDDITDLFLSDPTIAMQYYDRGDIRRYIAIESLLNGGDLDSDSDDYDIFDP